MTEPTFAPQFVRSPRSPGGWVVELPYRGMNGDVVTVAKGGRAQRRLVVQLTTFHDFDCRVWSYKKIGKIHALSHTFQPDMNEGGT